MRLIVGLGNPGAQYVNHRHNVGFQIIDAIADKHQNGGFVKKFHGLAKQINLSGQRVLLLKPQTFMNKSGVSVAEAARFYKIAAKDILVIHDELDLEPGKVRVKVGGSSGGHNGLKSIDAHLGNGYQRLRIGIGHPGSKAQVNGHVLSNFASSDQQWLDPLIEDASLNIDRLLRGDNAGFLNKISKTRAMAPKKPKNAETANTPMAPKVEKSMAQPAAQEPADAMPEQTKTASKQSKAAPKEAPSIWQALKARWMQSN